MNWRTQGDGQEQAEPTAGATPHECLEELAAGPPAPPLPLPEASKQGAALSAEELLGPGDPGHDLGSRVAMQVQPGDPTPPCPHYGGPSVPIVDEDWTGCVPDEWRDPERPDRLLGDAVYRGCLRGLPPYYDDTFFCRDCERSFTPGVDPDQERVDRLELFVQHVRELGGSIPLRGRGLNQLYRMGFAFSGLELERWAIQLTMAGRAVVEWRGRQRERCLVPRLIETPAGGDRPA